MTTRSSISGALCLLLFCLCVVGSFTSYSCVTEAKTLVEPPEVRATRKGNTAVNLVVRPHRVSIPLRGDDDENGELFFEYTGRFYFREGENEPLMPGPTLRVVPGGKIKLQVKNELDNETANPNEVSMNTFHHPNTTNVHFHGVHGDPKVDDPFTTVESGGELFYKLSISRDHEPGMHWYHAHSHGSVYQQVMGGLFGAIVVGDGTWLAAPKHPFRDWNDAVMMIHLYRLGASDRCDGTTMQQLDAAMGTGMPANPQVVTHAGKVRPLPADLYLVNGQHRPTVTVTQGTPKILRLAFAAGSCHLNLTLPPQCRFNTFAIDGVQLRRTRERRWIYFTTATRVETAVVCDATGEFPVALSGDKDEVIFYVESTAGKRGKSKSKVSFPVNIPKYSPDYLDLNGPRRFRREISLSQLDLPEKKPYYVLGQGENCTSLRNDTTCFYEPFPGKVGDDQEKYHGFAVPLHAVVTARVHGDPTDTVPHPLHFHVNHFQFLSFEPRVGGLHENHTMEMYGIVKNQFRDTIPILDGVTTIRWQAASYLGEVVYHCHALHHEDRGMMLSYLVYPDWMPPLSSNIRQKTSSTTRHALSAALFAMLLIAASLALVIVGLRWYREHPARNYDAYYTEGGDTEMVRRTSPRTATEATPLVHRV